MEIILYSIFGLMIIIILIVWLRDGASDGFKGFGAIIARLFFSEESYKRVVCFFSVAFIIGLVYGVYSSSGSTLNAFGEHVFFCMLKAIIIGLILVTIVNAIYIIFRLDQEPNERNKYTEKERQNDLKRIEAKKVQAASIYSKNSVTASAWHTGF